MCDWEMNVAAMTTQSIVAAIVFVMITTVIPETNATTTQINHKTFEKCFKKYASDLDRVLSLRAKQLIENRFRSGGTIDINNIKRNDNIYNCVHGLPIHPEVDLTTGKVIK
jgi:hypothetical protein